MSSVSHLSSKLITVDPVNVGLDEGLMVKKWGIYLIGTSKEVGVVLGECHGAYSSPDLCSLFDFHGLD